MSDRQKALRRAPREGDLTVTALYTSAVWSWGGLPCAELLATPAAKKVFDVTNAALAVTRLFKPRLASLRCSLLHRHAMIDHLVAEVRPAVVVELAAGLSRRGAAMTANPALRYVEVDRPSVVAHKRELLARTEEGRRVLARPGLELVGADVRDGPLEAWIGAADGPVVVVAEGLLMYLAADAQRALFARVAAALRGRPGSRFVFDLVPSCEEPPPGLLGRALGWLMKRATRGKTFERDARTRDDIARDLLEAGFARVERLEPAAVASAWDLPLPGARTQMLIFACAAAGAEAPPASAPPSA